MTKELRRIERDVPKLNLFTGQMVATFARTLSAIERDRKKGGGRGEYSDLSMEQLLEKAMQVPELRDLLKASGAS